MNNIPRLHTALVTVSRDCFPIELARKRHNALHEECRRQGVEIDPIATIVENEHDVIRVCRELDEKACNCLVVYLGNFGPEGPLSMLAQRFDGTVLLIGAAEESAADLIDGRGDAYCGMLSASYNLGLRGVRVCLPECPVGLPHQLAGCIHDFQEASRIVLGLKKLKILSFGPRPSDFYTCHAPIKPLFDLGVEICENSELDLLELVQAEQGKAEIESIARDMARELGQGNSYPDLLPKLAQYELALKNYAAKSLGDSWFGVFANKCWPAFERQFGHVPCFVNARLAAQGIPVACEADIYGALSEYMLYCAAQRQPTLLDINNTVPEDLIRDHADKLNAYQAEDLWMGFHCGNTGSACLIEPCLRYQLIMHRLIEPGQTPNISRGTLDGRIKPGAMTMFRLQSTAEGRLKSYIAQGDVLDIPPQSFGGIGVMAVRNMRRFYRHVLLEERFPHHTALGFGHLGRPLFSALTMLGIQDRWTNLPSGSHYPSENPYADA